MPQDYNDLKKALIILFEMFDKSDRKELFTLYYSELQKYDGEKITEQIGFLIRTSKFFPRLAEIIGDDAVEYLKLLKRRGELNDTGKLLGA